MVGLCMKSILACCLRLANREEGQTKPCSPSSPLGSKVWTPSISRQSFDSLSRDSFFGLGGFIYALLGVFLLGAGWLVGFAVRRFEPAAKAAPLALLSAVLFVAFWLAGFVASASGRSAALWESFAFQVVLWVLGACAFVGGAGLHVRG